MDQNNLHQTRQFGIYYTPKELAIVLADQLITSETKSVFDPAYGEGSLLLASQEIINERNYKHLVKFFGCDLHPINGLLGDLSNAQLVQEDFFDYKIDTKFDVIISNPPYIRHQQADISKTIRYREIIKELQFLDKKSDLWSFFIVKSLLHLREGGALGAILPWSFLQADYAITFRKWLLSKFKNISVWAMTKPYFAKTNERTLLIWMQDYGSENKNLKLAFSYDINQKPEYINLDQDTWTYGKLSYVQKKEILQIDAFLRENLGFKSFSDLAKVRIGIVTGADGFFIRKASDWNNYNVQNEVRIPILSSVKEMESHLLDGQEVDKELIILKEPEICNELLEEGIKLNIHLRSHSRSRRKWYGVTPGEVPDAFFSYRTSSIPFLLLNESKVQCTNSIHRIYFNNLTREEMKWIFVSILSTYGQLFLEFWAKTYGRGVLKIEPGVLSKVPVFISKNNSTINDVYDRVMESLNERNKYKASEIATEYINEELKIDPGFFLSSKILLDKIRVSRSKNY